MTRKYYIKLAGVLKHKRRHYAAQPLDKINGTDKLVIDSVLLTLADDFATVLEQDNPNFDKHRFMDAVMED